MFSQTRNFPGQLNEFWSRHSFMSTRNEYNKIRSNIQRTLMIVLINNVIPVQVKPSSSSLYPGKHLQLYPGIEFSQSCVHFTPGILHSSISMRNDEKRSCVSIWFPVLYRACHFIVKRNFACVKDSKSYASWGFCPL